MVYFASKNLKEMKKLIVTSLLICIVFACNKEESLPPGAYEIHIKADGVYNGVRAYLKPTINARSSRFNVVATDTAIAVNESLLFTGKIEHPSIQYLTINSVKGNFSFILEPGVTTIEVFKDSITSSLIINSPNNNKMYSLYKEGLEEKNKVLNSIRTKMNQARINNQPQEYRSLYEESLSVIEALENYPFEFIQSSNNNDLSILLLGQLIDENKINDYEKLKSSIAPLNNTLNKNNYYANISRKLNAFISRKEAEARVNIGRIAPNFSGITPEGKSISLNDIKGKATIIDFWAAWCAPCRKENPNVVKVYEKYHDKGLEIISVSLDGRSGQRNPREAWLKAIEDDKLNWHHVSSLNYFNDASVRLYNVNAIPATFILDENGVIVSKRLRGQALENKIAEILSKQGL